MEGFGELFDAAADGFVYGVVHGEVEAAADAGVGFDAQLFHLADGPEPDVVFLFAAFLVFLEADRVVADLVEEDGEADGGLGVGGFDPVHGAAVGVVDAPGAAAHAGAPLANAEVVGLSHLADDRGEWAHGQLEYRHGRGFG